MAIESLQANQGIYKALSKLTGKDYYKTKTGVIIKTDKGKGSVTYNKETGEITCEGLENALITGSAKADKINIVDCKNIKATGGLGNDEFTIKYSDTVQINGGLGKDQVTLYDNPKNVKLKSIENEISATSREFNGNGEIEWSEQCSIGDCWYLSQVNAMSYTEAGRKIIKESIVWDDENRQAIVHCKGLGIDMVISYDELKEAEEKGNQFYELDKYAGGHYSEGDDDVFLLEYAMTKLSYLEDNKLIDFQSICSNPTLYVFLAGAEEQFPIYDEAQIKEFLDKLEADGGKNLAATAATSEKIPEESAMFGHFVTDANGKKVRLVVSHAYAIKEVKDGLVTVVNPWNSSDDSKYTATFTYDEFCKYFLIFQTADLSKTTNETQKIYFREGVNPSDYGIAITSGKEHILKRDSVIQWTDHTPICSESEQIKNILSADEGAKLIKESILWDDENKEATVHCKGLGIDITISYDELKNARENSEQMFDVPINYLPQDDDLFLLEYVSNKLKDIKNEGLINFICVNNDSPEHPATFLANTREEMFYDSTDKSELIEFLKRIESDNKQKLGFEITVKCDEGYHITENDPAFIPQCKIKEIKDGFITIANPSGSGDDLTFSYEDFCQYLYSARLIDLSKPSEETPEIIIDNSVNLSDYGITITTGILRNSETEPTPEPTDPPREFDGNGEIGSFKPGSINDSWFLSELNAMSYTEEGRRIIKESIEWDDENRQVTVHCNGLGIDMVVTYDELKEARDKGNKYYEIKGGNEGKTFSTGDDDVFLLEYVMTKLSYLRANKTITFNMIDTRPNLVIFLAGAETQSSIYNEAKIKEFLDKLEADGGQNLYAVAGTKDLLNQNEFAIKEVKDGFVTVIDPADPTDDSEKTMILSYEDFCERFVIYEYLDFSETANPAPVAYIEGDTKFSDYGITITTAKVERSNRNGEIEWSKQGQIGDCGWLSTINAMSYTEAGRKIIKESIVWDDENRQAIVHCKGLGIDMVVTYDELKYAEEYGTREWSTFGGGRKYSSGDDDVLLLEYVWDKLLDIRDEGLIQFDCADNLNPQDIVIFLANAKYSTKSYTDENDIKEILERLEENNNKDFFALTTLKSEPGFIITDANGKEVSLVSGHFYAIKEVKDGLITVVNPWNSSNESILTATLTYDDFCKYFGVSNLADLSKQSDKTLKIIMSNSVNLSDYGITPMPGTVVNINRMLASFDERVINESTPYKEAELSCGFLCIDTTTDGVQSYNEIKINDNDQILNIIKEDLNSQDKIKAFKFTGDDTKTHWFINDNGNIRHYIGQGSNVINDNNFYEEIKMTDDEFKNYLYSILDSQEYITGYSIYADYEESPKQTIASAQDEITSNTENEAISEPIDITITNLIPDSNPAPPPEPEVIFIPEPEPEPTEAEHTILDAGLDMKKSERKGTLTFEQQTPEPEPAEAPQKTTFKTISGSFLKTTGKISKK